MLVFVVIAEDVGVVAFDGGDALLLLQLLHGRDQVAILGGAFILLRLGGLLPCARAATATRSVWSPFEKQLHVAHRFLVDLRRRQVFHARSQAALDVVLQTRPRMIARQIDLARRNQKVAMDQIDDAVGQVGGEVRAVVSDCRPCAGGASR